MRSDPTVQTILDTSLSDNCEDVTIHDVIIGSDDNEQQAARHSPLATDNQRELPDKACPPLFERDDRYHDDRAVLPPVQPEIDKRERRYSHDGYDVGIHHNVVVHSTRLSPSQSDAYEERCIYQACFPADPIRTRVRPEEEGESFQANYNPVTTLPDFHHPSLTLTKNAVSIKHVFQRIVSVLASDRKKKESHSKPIITLSRLDRKQMPSMKQKTFICLQASSNRDS